MTVTEHATALIARASRIVGFTGAGISTESGIPDFRSTEDGLWTRHSSPTLHDFESSEAARVEFWRMALDSGPRCATRGPTPDTTPSWNSTAEAASTCSSRRTSIRSTSARACPPRT